MRTAAGLGNGSGRRRAWRRAIPAAAVITALAAAGAAAEARWDSAGRLVRLPLPGGGSIPLRSEVALPDEGWQSVGYLSEARDLRSSAEGGAGSWSGLVAAGDRTCIVTQRLSLLPDGVGVKVSRSAGPSEGSLYYQVHVPAGWFAGGTFSLDGRDGTLPPQPRRPYVLDVADVRRAVLRPAGAPWSLVLTTERPLTVQVQDSRAWNPEFSLLVTVAKPEPSEPSSAALTLRVEPDAAAAQAPPSLLTVHPAQVLQRFEGFGGNYCYGIDTPVSDLTRRHLAPPVARVQMSLDVLTPPPPPGADPFASFERMLLAADRPWTPLWRELQNAASLRRQGARLMVAQWRAPEWAVRPPLQENQNRVPPQLHPMLAQAVSAYLHYARQARGLEYEWYSINEPDWGANVLYTPAEYRRWTVIIGNELRSRGLATTILLGDLANPRDPVRYLDETLADAEALRHAGALSFHSWGGAQPYQYAFWRDLANRLRLPLVVAEAGVDPDWRNVDVHRYAYALSELALYQDLLTHARPQMVLLYEYSDDYPLLKRVPGGYRPTERFAFQRHWLAFTPPGAEGIAVTVEPPTVAATAFRVPSDGGIGWTLHLANLRWEQKLRLTGLPPELGAFNVVRTSRGRLFEQGDRVRTRGGSAELILPAESMTTLSTRPVPPWPFRR